MARALLIALLALPLAAGAAQAQVLTESYKGECLALVTPSADQSNGCSGMMFRVTQTDGSIQYTAFPKDGWGIAFLSTKPDAGKPDEMPVNMVLRSTKRSENGEDAHMPANGRCIRTGETTGPVRIKCEAETKRGTYRFEFLTDGNPPLQLHRN